MSSIYNNLMSLNAQNARNKNVVNQGKVLEKLSSGLAINRAADDAAGLAISQKMRATIEGLKRSSQNAQDGVSYVQACDAALDEVSNILARCAYLVEQRYDGINDQQDLDAINTEIDNVHTQGLRIIRDTKFNGIGILDPVEFGIAGTDATFPISREEGAFKYWAEGDTERKYPYIEYLARVVLPPGDDGFVGIPKLEGQLNSEVASLGEIRSYYGAVQNRMDAAKNNVMAIAENLQAAESVIRDADMAGMMSFFTKFNILVNASNSMLAQANSTPQQVLTLLQQ